jgi:phenylpropionate dioxygenase-like ring-hydroxylating dioxygenase large terminal subunit
MDRIFKRLPLLLAFTCEMLEAGDYKAMDVIGAPVLIAPGKDGVVRAFVTVCSHRGTVVANEGKGTCTRFVCPYHGWTYSDRSELIGVAGRRKFGLDRHRCTRPRRNAVRRTRRTHFRKPRAAEPPSTSKTISVDA